MELGERHDDWTEPDPDDREYVCASPACPNYSKAVFVRCRTELGHASPVDDHDLDCPCGARLVEQGGIEHVTPEVQRRYQEVGA
jgi:hypothetical protein